jgi:hemoglobin
MTSTTLDRDAIATLVHIFYDDVRADPVLGPVFVKAIGDHWDAHLARMVEFWSTVMLGSRDFQGNVFGKHMALSGIEPDHFRRWLALFQDTATRLFASGVANEFLLVAGRIAASLQYGYFGKVVVPPPAAPA